MGRVSKYPEELRERAVRMVAEVRPQYPSQWAAITAVAGMLGIGTPETLRTWIRRAEVDTGQRPGVTSQGDLTPCVGHAESRKVGGGSEMIHHDGKEKLP